MAIEIRLLGGLEIAADGRRVSLPTRKTEALLARLALRPGEPVSRAQLAGLLWPDRPDAQGRGSLRQALAAIRRAFEEAGAPGPSAGGDAVSLDARGVSVDVARLGAAIAGTGDLAEAIALHRGPLLAGFPPVEDTFDAWVESERAVLERRMLTAIRAALARGVAGDEVLALAEVALAIDPAFEEGWRARMRALAARGDRAGALREYERCRETLRRELSVAPAPETETLRRELAGETPRAEPSPTRTPGLAVLPFELLSADPAHEAFARGLQEDVIGALSRFRTLRVVAPAAGRREAPAGVDYLLVATVRAACGRLRVAARLAVAQGDAQLWSERFEGDLADAFALQDRVAEAVAGALALRIDEAELRAAARLPPESLEAHALWLRGMQCLKRGSPESDLEARRLFEQALARDRDYARAWAGLSLSHFNDWSCAAWDRWDETERRAFEYAAEAIRRDPHDPVTQCILGRILLYRREFERAAEHLSRAHALNPNEPDVLAHLAVGYAYLGEPERGLALGEAARRLNPFHADWYLPCVAANHLVARRPGEALDLLARAPDGHVDTRAFLAVARAHLGDDAGARDDARRFVERFRAGIVRGRPFAADEPVRWVLHVNPLRRPEDREWVVAGLARAGLACP
ncbi:BTAD domain-containing putative transcriptional regulator [Anaeromyxobacter sp. Fw109-5]|uniref:BTAD domain-containing putative transcriptional regulator n=1 Tax=Anaeromyxobacter sp. (strain Fw109-5) TaxID=404589 RepID=UPI0000ED7634|nr:BTAD domain-containing putative transcriptional regulator [Anaeromyxobacter sp. Fw109-5]ABS25938.1 transcriptional regulator, SARP family [Anaeromyxobacter sp. Fw109-5]